MGKLKTLTAFLVGIVLVTVGFALNTFQQQRHHRHQTVTMN